MLRRRILASAMASVMAIGSIAVVASAEDTAVAVKNVKSKADLEAFVKQFDKFRDSDVFDYGTNSADKFTDAIEYADQVLEDSDSDAEDYTAAYTMLEAVYKQLQIKDAAALKDLLKSFKDIYDGANIMNPDLGDLIYDETKYSNFNDAYIAAENVVDSGDTRLTTDAWFELNDAKNALTENTVITKKEFRTALQKYETLIKKLSQYDSWRRGAANCWYENDGVINADFWALSNNVKNGVSTYGALTTALFGQGAQKPWGYVNIFAHYDPKAYDTVQDYITSIYEKLDNEKSVVKTTNEDYVNAYKTCERAVEIFNKWTVDNTTRANKASVTKLLDKYHKQLVAEFKATEAEGLYDVVNKNNKGYKGVPARAEWTDSANQFYAAELKNEGTKGDYTAADGVEVFPDGKTSVSIAKGISLLKYIDVKSGELKNYYADFNAAPVKADFDKAEDYTKAKKAYDDALYNHGVLVDALKEALGIAEDYLAEQWSDTVYGIDETGAVSKGSGSITEWTLVNRRLQYALEDMYAGSASATYSKSQVSKLIDDSYDITHLTGDAAIFATEHMALVDARQDALDWVRAANKIKTYRDGDAVACTGIYDGKTSTDVYNAINTLKGNLEKKFGDYKYGYDEIYKAIYEVAGKIDSDAKYDVDAIKTALAKTAYDLSVLQASNVDNDPFTTDRVFVDYNRLHTANNAGTGAPNGYETALKASYESLLAEVKKVEEVVTKLGDVNNDGKVDMLDAKALLDKIVAKEEVDVKIGDYDGNSKVEIADAKAILEAYNKNGNKPL